METGALRGLLSALIVALLALIGFVVYRASTLAKIELGVIIAILVFALIWRYTEARALPPEATSPNLRSTTALWIARKLRTNVVLVWFYRAVFSFVVPIAFALGLVGGGRLAYQSRFIRCVERGRSGLQ